jgi:hypothetical protein
MLKITEDDARNCLLVTPEGRLTESDFDALTAAFNDRANRTDRIPNLVIHAKTFPGWSDFGGLVGHLNFVRGHHKLIPKIALVSDARILDIAPSIARHFLYADIRHFPDTELQKALDWVAEADAEPAAVSLIDGLPSDVLGLSVRGEVSARDYSEVIVPAVEKKLQDHARIKLLYHVTPEFESVTAGAMWSDARVGLMHLTRFSRIALVTDQAWMRNALRVFAPLVPGEVRVFTNEEYATALEWLARAADGLAEA